MLTSSCLTVIEVELELTGIVVYRNVVIRVSRDPMTVRGVYIQWVQEDNTECRAESQWPTIINNR